MFKVIVHVCLMMVIIFSTSARADDPLEPIATKICTPTDVSLFFGSRLHIRCTTPLRFGNYETLTIHYFSVSANDYDDLDHVLKMATSAITAGNTLKLWVRTSYNGNPSGCSSSNCRRITGISLLR